MSLSALPTFLLVPPANLMLTACVGAWYHRHRAGRIVLGASLALLVALSIPVVSHGLLLSLEVGLPLTPPADDKPGAIVVLSADAEERWDTGERDYDVGYLTLVRERAGAALARKTGLPILLTGGHEPVEIPALADLMATSMRDDFNVPAKWLESESRDTWQNAEFSAKILKENKIDSVYVVSHPWHLRRAFIAFRHFGLKMTAAPTLIDGPPRMKIGTFLPSAQALETSYFALHEWIGCAIYALRDRFSARPSV